MKVEGSIKICVDNQSTINLAKNPVAHGRSKHIETRLHFLREQMIKGKLELIYSKTEDEATDILTKPLKIDRFESLRSMLGGSL